MFLPLRGTSSKAIYTFTDTDFDGSILLKLRRKLLLWELAEHPTGYQIHLFIPLNVLRASPSLLHGNPPPPGLVRQQRQVATKTREGEYHFCVFGQIKIGTYES